jgi:tetratricopeptide (TPR) repeat protein
VWRAAYRHTRPGVRETPGLLSTIGRTADYCRCVATRGAFFTDKLQARLRRLEAELDEYPDQRGEILRDIAIARRRLGEMDRAVDIWRYLIAQGGEDSDYARVELAEYLFGQGLDEDARAELAAVKVAGRTSSAAWTLVAELLEERGEMAEALAWYRMAGR